MIAHSLTSQFPQWTLTRWMTGGWPTSGQRMWRMTYEQWLTWGQLRWLTRDGQLSPWLPPWTTYANHQLCHVGPHPMGECNLVPPFYGAQLIVVHFLVQVDLRVRAYANDQPCAGDTSRTCWDSEVASKVSNLWLQGVTFSSCNFTKGALWFAFVIVGFLDES